jgi:hypothetical protein
MTRKKHEEEPVEDAVVEEIEEPIEEPEDEPEPEVEDVDPEPTVEEYDPTPVDPNTVGGGVPFEPDTRTIAEQLAALTPGVGG